MTVHGTVHPAFHPYADGSDGGIWRCRAPRRQAATLRELQARLGPGYDIEGYYPNGFRTPPWPAGVAHVPRIVLPHGPAPTLFFKNRQNRPRQPEAITHMPVQSVAEADKRTPNHRYDQERVLDMWNAGMPGPEIGRALGLHGRHTAAQIVSRARRRGDPRAWRRGPKHK